MILIIRSNSVGQTGNIVKSSSFFLAAYMCVPAINAVLEQVVGGLFGIGIMSVLYIIISFALLIHCVFFLSRRDKKTNFKYVLLFFAVLLFYLSTYLRPVTTTIGIVEFAIYVILPMFFSQCLAIDVRCFLKSALILPCFGILYLSDIFVVDFQNQIEMGICYAFLFPIIANIAYLFFYFKWEKKWQKLFTIVGSICNFAYVTKLVMHGSRGPLLTIIVCIAFYFLFHTEGDKLGIKLSGYKAIITTVVVAMITMNFWQILGLANSALLKQGVELKFLEKMLRLYSAGDVLNGRNLDYEAAIEGIIRSPLIGNGLATFEYYTGYVYPHNLVLQILFDGGVILFAFILIPVLVSVFEWVKRCNQSSFILISVMLIASVPGAMFSGDAWTKPILWFAFSLVCVIQSNLNEFY